MTLAVNNLAGFGGSSQGPKIYTVGTFVYDDGANSDSHTFSGIDAGTTVASGDLVVAVITGWDAGGTDATITTSVTIDGQSAVVAVQPDTRVTGMRKVTIAAATGVTGATFDVVVTGSGYTDTVDDWGCVVLCIPSGTSTTAKDSDSGGSVEVDLTIAGTLFAVAAAGADNQTESGGSVLLAGSVCDTIVSSDGFIVGVLDHNLNSATASPTFSGFVELSGSRAIATYG